MNLHINVDQFEARVEAEVNRRMSIGRRSLVDEAIGLGLDSAMARSLPVGLIMDGLEARPMTPAEVLAGSRIRDDYQDMDPGRGGDVPMWWHPARDIGRSPLGPATGVYIDELLRLRTMFNGQQLQVNDDYGDRRSVLQLSGMPWGMNRDFGRTTLSDAAQLHDLFHSQLAKIALDVAPNLFIAQELIKATNKIVERDRVQTSARVTFPIFRVNTWYTQWFLQRVDDSGAGISEFSDPESPVNRPPQATVYRNQVPRPLAFHDAGATWHAVTLARIAEARSNGFPGSINFEARVLEAARRYLLVRENVMTFFGAPNKGIKGILSTETGIPRYPAVAKLGNASVIVDYNTIVDAVKLVIDRVVNTDKPNALAVGTKTWLHLNTRIYETPGTGGSKTLAQMILQALQPMGISEIRWLPELGYRAQEEQQWVNFGRDAAEAAAWAGGVDKKEAMLVWKNDSESGEMIVGRELATFPDTAMVRGQTGVTMTMSNGGFEPYKPKRFALVTDIGPDSVFVGGDPVIDENDGE